MKIVEISQFGKLNDVVQSFGILQCLHDKTPGGKVRRSDIGNILLHLNIMNRTKDVQLSNAYMMKVHKIGKYRYNKPCVHVRS